MKFKIQKCFFFFFFLARLVCKKTTEKIKSVIEKRPMLRMAEIEDVFGVSADIFFQRSKNEIKQIVMNMNHATRFYLGVKFYRENKIDFESNCEIKIDYSKK